MDQNVLQLPVWAVVGATDNPQKFGCKIYKFMKAAGYEVFPVNPGVKTLDGAPCYASLAELPKKPDAIDVVVPPRVGEQVLRDAAKAGIRHVWLQPGAESEALIVLGEQLGLKVIHHDCIMTAIRSRKG